jgi:hypothetical protein
LINVLGAEKSFIIIIIIGFHIWSYHYTDGLVFLDWSCYFWGYFMCVSITVNFAMNWICVCLVLNLFQSYCTEDEPGKQVRSAIGIKNTSKSHVAFKVWLICQLFFFINAFYVYHFFGNYWWYDGCCSSKQLHQRAVTCVLPGLYLHLVKVLLQLVINTPPPPILFIVPN